MKDFYLFGAGINCEAVISFFYTKNHLNYFIKIKLILQHFYQILSSFFVELIQIAFDKVINHFL